MRKKLKSPPTPTCAMTVLPSLISPSSSASVSSLAWHFSLHVPSVQPDTDTRTDTRRDEDSSRSGADVNNII